jgi:hypothetical protein
VPLIKNGNAKSEPLNTISGIRMDSYARLNVQFEDSDIY